MKRSHTIEEEGYFSLLEECCRHKDIWSEVKKRLTVVDELIMTFVSKLTRISVAVDLASLSLHFLKFCCWNCGSTSPPYHIGPSCILPKCTDIIYDIYDSYDGYGRRASILEEKKVSEIELWELDEQHRTLVINVSLREAMCPNVLNADKRITKFYQLSVPIAFPEKEADITCLYDSVHGFEKVIDMQRVYLSREEKLSEYELMNLTKDLECSHYE